MIKLNEKFLSPFVRANEVAQMEAELEAARKTVMDKSGAGSDFLGWLDLPVDYDKEEFARIKTAAAKIQKSCDVLVVIGIGGSYLGARAAIEFLRHNFYNMAPKSVRKTPITTSTSLSLLIFSAAFLILANSSLS